MSSLEDELEDLKDDLEDSDDVTGSDPGPLSQQAREAVSAHLDRAETRIARIQDPGTSPSLNPPDAGTIDASVTPQTLPEYADVCVALAGAAHVESTKAEPDDDLIGTKLKTIRSLLPGYRHLAGIN